MKVIVFCLAALFGLGLSGARAADLANDEQKALYALGVAISQSLNDFALSEPELEIVKFGLSDGILKRTLKVDMQTFKPKIQQLAQSRAAVVAEREKKGALHSWPRRRRSPAPRRRRRVPS